MKLTQNQVYSPIIHLTNTGIPLIMFHIVSFHIITLGLIIFYVFTLMVVVWAINVLHILKIFE